MVIFGSMRSRIKILLALSLPLQWLLLSWAAARPEWVEQWYSRGLYPWLSGFFRFLYGWIPFSVGDLLYFALGLLALGYLVRYGYRIRTHFWAFLRDVLAVLAVLHLTFYLLWGLNYFRQPLSAPLGLDESYTEAELLALSGELVQEANALQADLAGDTVSPVRLPYSRRDILLKTEAAYELLSEDHALFRYERPSLKASLFSTLLSYMGYGGYLNPFTGEAQVNDRLPIFQFPAVCGHEVGHQLGYSAENETNFIGYLATREHPDPYFRYSAATFALSYCLAEVNRRDSLARKELTRAINPGVRANYAEVKEFWEHYQNPLEPVFKALFNRYLEVNRQKDGIASYNRIVSLLVAYRRKEGVAGTGLDREKALQLVTGNTAKILGIDDRYGTLAEGKSATLFVSEGDALDIRTNRLTHAFIDGREISLETHQTELWKRYSGKYSGE